MQTFRDHKKIDDASLRIFIEDETKRKQVLEMITASSDSIIGKATTLLREKVFYETNFRMKYGIVRDEKLFLRNELVNYFCSTFLNVNLLFSEY